MRNPFRTEPAVAADKAEAYREGRADERDRRIRERAVPADADLKTAYERGRQEERRRLARRRHPVLGFLALVAVVALGLFIYLAVRNGSVAGAGAVVDNNIDQAQHDVNAPLKGAALKAGDALQKAGQSLK